MNEGVLIRYLGKWMTFWRPLQGPLGLGLQGGVPWGELRFIGGLEPPLRTRMLTLSFVFKCELLQFSIHVGRCGDTKMESKSDFWNGFFDVFFERAFDIVFG